jgi:hypothetical protein
MGFRWAGRSPVLPWSRMRRVVGSAVRGLFQTLVQRLC